MARFGWRLLGWLALGLATPALAAGPSPAFQFRIPQSSLREELTRLAVEANLSINLGRIDQCQGRGRALVGRFTAEAGLRRILEGSHCGFRFIDAGAVDVFPLKPAPKPAAAPAEPPQSPVTDVAPLVISATRQPEPIDRLAYPVSGLDARLLRTQAITDANDLAAATPSMTVTNLGAGRDKILLRGLSDGPLTGRSQSMVGIYLGPVRITSNAPDPDLKLVDMAQVEVLRGPQGALYGSGSLGGVLHLVPAAPDPSGMTAWISVSASATRGGSPSDDVEGMVNLPLLGGRGALRLVGYRERLGGYIDDTGLGLRDVNSAERHGTRISLAVDLDADWRLSIGRVDQAINNADTQYAPKPGSLSRSLALREPHDSDFSADWLTVDGDLGWGRMTWTAARVGQELTSRYDATPAPPVPLPPGPAAFDDDNNIDSWVSEASLLSPPDARIGWLVGVFYADTHQIIGLDLARLAPTPVNGFSERRQDHLREAALFGQVTLPLNDDLQITAGGRWFISRTRVSSLIQAPLAATSAAYDGRFSQSGFAPKLVIAYTPRAGLVLYAQASEGYRAGGINTTGAPGQNFGAPGGAQPFRQFQGDELWNIEAGASLAGLDGRLTLRAAVFAAHWRNIQSDQLLPDGLPFTANIGDGRNRGIEAEASYRSGGLTLRGSVLYNNPELDRANPAFPARADLRLAGVPDLMINLGGQYGWDLEQDRRLELDGRIAYVGRSDLTFDATTFPRMGDYATGRLAATLSNDRWRLTLAVENPADAGGDTFAFGNPFTVRMQQQSTPLRPRTASVTLRAQF